MKGSKHFDRGQYGDFYDDSTVARKNPDLPKRNGMWRPASLGTRRLVIINSATEMVRMRIEARINRLRDAKGVMEANWSRV